ncbi:MAG: dienelactone hydrolase family protein [Parachlamydiales bacterium]|jgi:dienelactone hydrolase
MLEETLTYYVRDTACKGFLAYDNTIEEQRPGIIIAPAWRGLDDFAKGKARELARLGYAVLAADIYGNGTKAHNDEEAAKLMTPLFLDRKLLQERIQGAYRALLQCPACSEDIGAIGFCFGGLTVIELLRSGTPVKGVVSFHGVLGNTFYGETAHTVPIASKIIGSILLLHGHDDPLVSKDDITSLQNELTSAKVDWQMHIYGNTSHAFTNPNANDTAHGLVYNQKAALRSWKSMQNFFKEVFP